MKSTTTCDLLIDTVHRIGARAEGRVERELIEDLKRVAGKNSLLFQLAEVSRIQPESFEDLVPRACGVVLSRGCRDTSEVT